MVRSGFLWSCFLVSALSRLACGQELDLQAATQDHPHVRAILDGRVKAQGCKLHLSIQTSESLNADVAGPKRFDIVEVDLVRYLQKYSAGELQDYVLLPVFLMREFQLRNIYIRSDRGIAAPSDLRGKTVGVSGYGSATPTWIRGFLQSSWSVKPSEITWLDTETSTRTPRSLAEWIQRGEVDAIFSRVPPPAYTDKNGKVIRLFENFHNAEYGRFKTTRVFPIGSALAMRKKIAEENPWVSEAVFLAFSESKKKALADLTLPLPWEGSQLKETEDLMGKNFWSYGVKNNPKSLGTLFRYLKEQGLLQRPLAIKEVFETATVMLIED